MEVKITFDEVNVRDTQKINDIDIVMVKGEKGDTGYPTDAQVATAVDEWLTEHPEATTTVQDGSITLPKLANDVRAEIDTKADAIVKSASGSIASFSDGGDDLPMKSLKVNIVPTQSGSGDPSPSNVRPISGWDSVNVYISPTTLEEDGETITINLPQTVYGGTLDVVSGELTIDSMRVDMGSVNWVYSSTYNMFYATLSPQPLASVVPSSTWYAVCECYKYQDNILTTNRTMDKVCEIGRQGYYINDFLVRDTTFGTSASDFKASVSGKYLVYKLISSTTITLTPTQVKTLLGSNNIWSESGTVEVEYRADSTLAYEELLSLIANL